jgi:hypothetical protein|mmetsp:Transcript_45887/g.127466  ORF Transcript_45887/g.127466 Transcript_45887/m.127466 type:complete len:92 (+) Transcript_45887:102-377(+)
MFALYHAKRVYVTNSNALVGIVNSEVLHERLSGVGIAIGAAPSVAGRVHGGTGFEDRMSITLDGPAENSSTGTEMVDTGNGEKALASQEIL